MALFLRAFDAIDAIIGFFVVASLFLLSYLLYFLVIGEKKAAAHMRIQAKKAAASLWIVEDTKTLVAGLGFTLRHLSFTNHSWYLPVHLSHPDIALFQLLEHGDQVEFEALEESTTFGFSGYLRIKSFLMD